MNLRPKVRAAGGPHVQIVFLPNNVASSCYSGASEHQCLIDAISLTPLGIVEV